MDALTESDELVNRSTQSRRATVRMTAPKKRQNRI